jgi:hypothetical protein
MNNKSLININKQIYIKDLNILRIIKLTKIPKLLDKNNLTLLALLNYFQKRFASKPFIINFHNLQKTFCNPPYNTINIISKLNNLPHLLGISGQRDKNGKIISKVKPQEFLDGVLYQWILINAHENFNLDFEKIEVFSWITQTLSNPSYILTKDAIRRTNTKFNSDLIFIRKILCSDKYAFHIVGLKNESYNNFAFISQFAISKNRFNRINIMFDLKKAIYNFYKK